jgi:prevent-host-death family protein
MKTLPLSEVKAQLSRLIDEVSSRDERVTITRNGKPVAVLVSLDESESWQETAAIRSDAELVEEIRAGVRSVRRGAKLYTLEELFQE